VAGLAAQPAAPFRAFQLLAPLRPPFAALPFLNSQVRTERGSSVVKGRTADGRRGCREQRSVLFSGHMQFGAKVSVFSQALLAVGQELSLPAEGSLLTPVAAQQAPSFAAAPAFQAQLFANEGAHFDKHLCFQALNQTSNTKLLPRWMAPVHVLVDLVTPHAHNVIAYLEGNGSCCWRQTAARLRCQ
jgi:hypothetical protein